MGAQDRRGSEAVLRLMKGAEPLTAEELAARAGMSSAGMRLHLNELAAKGFVRFSEHRERAGRPLRRWSLTDAAGVAFPDAHEALAVELIASVKEIYGKAALQKLIARREKEMLARYRAAISPSMPIAKRVATLAQLRSEEGYMAESRKTSRGVLLIENHCPICAAAAACQKFCRSELRVFQQSLGDDVAVERTDHVLAGARRCAYLVSKRA
jgi:predicted ArsR family transcriptional regulator